jgi:hypothetical protein
MNLEKLAMRTAAAWLVAGAMMQVLAWRFQVPALYQAAKYAYVASVVVVVLLPLSAIAAAPLVDWWTRRRWAAEVRPAWEAASHRLGLRRTQGATVFDDTMYGEIDGARVEVTVKPDASVQKAITFVTFPGIDLDRQLSLSVGETIDLTRRDPPQQDADVLTEEQSAWLSGARKGLGARIANGNLEYLQPWVMTDADELVFVVRALAKMNRRIRAALRR